MFTFFILSILVCVVGLVWTYRCLMPRNNTRHGHIDDQGVQEWWVNGVRHRVGGPARILLDGSESWYEHDRLHRLDGPAITRANGDQIWMVDGKLHRLDGPAICERGLTQWFVNGQQHRSDGPAVISTNGKYRKWYVNDQDITLDVNKWMMAQEISWPWDESTQVAFQLTWL